MKTFQYLLNILGIKRDKNRIIQLVENSKDDYLNVFKNIGILLNNEKLFGQFNAIENLTITLINKEYEKFIKEINGINMWGGSGAVWEVYFQNASSQREFNIQMLQLINIMEETKVIGKGIKPLKKLFKEHF